MTLDEAIIHCEKVAKEKEEIAFDLTYTFNRETVNSKKCKRCAENHRQLAEWLKDYKRLKEQEPCDDVISRQAVLDAMRNNYRDGGRDIDGDYIEGNYSEKLYDAIMSLPPVTPQSKIGRWMPDNRPGGGFWVCSNCKFPSEAFAADRLYRYCPVCGCRMMKGDQL